jgi:exopolyphosphatase/pppGpp-phosphohydrolase
MTGMRVGVIDVGSNTVRLLVASVAGDTVRTLREERVHLGLGEEILHLRPACAGES